MTVRRGEDWGERGPLPAGAVVAGTDAELIDAVRAGLATDPSAHGPDGTYQQHLGDVGLVGGDLHRTLGAPRHTVAELHEGYGMRLQVDICCVEVSDGAETAVARYFCAHLVAMQGRGALFARRTLIAMNAAFRGDQNLAPRAHPGDGTIDTIEGSLGFWDRSRARRRFATGTHLPHPQLAYRRITEARYEFASPARLVLDGRDAFHARRFRIRCLPDAVTVVV